MPDSDFTAGKWPEIARRRDYQRLIRLAKRRLIGHEHHAEDVVSRAIIKWSSIPAERRAMARIEQVIKTEAFSFLRSELRSRERDTRAVLDPTLDTGRNRPPELETNLKLLRVAIAEACTTNAIRLTDVDVELFELILGGFSLAESQRTLHISRHELRKSIAKWRQVLGHVL